MRGNGRVRQLAAALSALCVPALAQAPAGAMPEVVAAVAERPAIPDAPRAGVVATGDATRDATGDATRHALGISAARTLREWGAACDGTADDSPAVARAAAALRGTGALIRVPADCRILMGPAARLAGSPPVLDSVGLAGDGTRDTSENGAYGTRGGTVLLTDTGGPAFVVRRGWSLRGLTFFWPGQVEDAQAPRTYPPLLAGQAGAGATRPVAPPEVSSGRFIDNDVVNAWVLADFSQDVAGGLQVRGNRGFCLQACWRLSSMPVESFFSDNQWTPNAFWNAPGLGVGPSFRLRDQAASHAAVLDIVADGTASADPTRSVDGMAWSNNVVFGMGYGIRIRGGWLNVSSFTGNVFDGTARVLSVEAGGRVTSASITGGLWYSYTLGAPGTATPAVGVAADARPRSSLKLTGVLAPSASGGLVDWAAPAGDLSLEAITADGLNSAPSGTASGIRMAAGGGRLRVIGGSYAMQGGAPGPCIDVQQPQQSLVVAGAQFVRCDAPVSVGGAFATPAVIAGNMSLATRGPSAYAGAQAAALPDAGNTWDKPVPGWSQATRGRDGALVFSRGGMPKLAILPDGSVRAAGAVTGNTTP